ncbi:MAG: hypothetical protein HOP28_04845 [Gemmatimonadales bacterium]|nr:hypothetical protein [Gemmatimonadales bacterium]
MPNDNLGRTDARWREALAPLHRPGDSAALETRVRASLAVQRGGRARLPGRRAWLAIAAIVLVALVGIWARGGSPTSSSVAGGQYLLLLYEGARYDARGASHEQLVNEYRVWAGGLARLGKLVEASEIAPEEQLLSGSGESTQAPAGVITGFFIIRAADEREAAAIAATCPHLSYGGEVAVRPLRAG